MFFREFKCEQLTSSEDNISLIKGFKSKNENDDLQDYLLNEKRAWTEDLDGETRVYLIKDKASNVARPMYGNKDGLITILFTCPKLRKKE